MGKGYRIAYDQPINQYEKSGKYVKTYSSIRDITSNYNNRRQIRYVCQRRQGYYTAIGFQWRYYKEHPNHENIQPYFKDTWSYGQKMVYRLLINSGIDFIVHWKPKWGNKKQYDFYIPVYQLIIEVNGRQHYMNVGNHWSKLVDQQDNDNKKREVALKNGIKSYFYIDTRFQRMQYIKESICKSGILEFLGILEVDWNDLIAFSLRGMDLAVKDIWDGGQHNAKKIAEIMQIYIFRYSDDCDDITPGELIKCRLPKKLKEESV